MKAKKFEILGALAAGCTAGWLLCAASGCFLPWMATARADDSYSYTCTGAEHELAQWDIGTDDPTEQARVTMVIAPKKLPVPPASLSWQPPRTAQIMAPDWNQSMAWHACGAAGDVITFVRR